MDPVHLYVALLDVLAYRERLFSDRDSGALTFREDLMAALRVFDDINETVFNVQAISDTILLTCSSHDQFLEFLRLLRQVFVAFMKQGLFVRGGIAYAKHFQNNRLTYGHAVARAYELEADRAVYPRIVVDENIIYMYEGGKDLMDIKGAGLVCKEHEVYFLDVLTSDNWAEVYEEAKKIYVNSCNSPHFGEKALSKHVRFERYLLTSQHAHPDPVPYVARIGMY